MIAAWMAYALVIAALVSIAALLAERVAILCRSPSRGVWVVALLSSLFLPLLFAWSGARHNEPPAAALIALAAQEKPPVYERSPFAWVGGESVIVARGATRDKWLLASWSVMSAVALATLAMGWLQLRRRLRSAVEDKMAGAAVTISDDVGPAVVGIVRPRIVIPGWLKEQEAETQGLVIAHELEHLRAQDVRVLGAAFLVVVLLPWNLPVWWQLQRLRFAMEMDCDARVLRGGHSRSAYSAVLLKVAMHVAPLRATAAGLSESGSSLERRIRAMHAPVRVHWRLLAASLATCSTAFVAVAANVAPPPAPLLTATGPQNGLPLLPTPVEAWKSDDAQLARAVGHFFPQLLTTQQEGRLYVWAIVNERGQVSHIDMDVQPSWVSEADFARNWQDFQQRAGLADSVVRQELIQQIHIGPNYSVLAWVTQPGAIARDASAPTFQIEPTQRQTKEARLVSTAEAQRRVIEHFDPAALSEGVPAGQELWFLIDADGNPQRAGRRAVITDPEAARLAMEKMFPDIRVGYVTRGTVVKDANGKRVPVSWQWLER